MTHTPPPGTWLTTLRHEELRQAAQRTDSANRRAAALAAGVEDKGTISAVADAVGVSREAVSKALREADSRAPAHPLADYLEIDLPRTGANIPTEAEWHALPDTERASAARRAAAGWGALAAFAAHTAADTRRACEALAEILLYDDEWSTHEELVALVRAALPGWGDQIPVTAVDIDALVRVLADTTDSLTARRRIAREQTRRWQQLAGDEPPSMANAD
jgi:transposase-like protein